MFGFQLLLQRSGETAIVLVTIIPTFQLTGRTGDDYITV